MYRYRRSNSDISTLSLHRSFSACSDCCFVLKTSKNYAKKAQSSQYKFCWASFEDEVQNQVMLPYPQEVTPNDTEKSMPRELSECVQVCDTQLTP